jgi:excisionase family DNA binding protein
MSKQKQQIQSNATAHRLAYSISEVADITGVGRSILYQEIGEGRLRARKLGRRSLIFDDDLKAWLAALPPKSRT